MHLIGRHTVQQITIHRSANNGSKINRNGIKKRRSGVIFNASLRTHLCFLPIIFFTLCLPSENAVLLDSVALLKRMLMRSCDTIAFTIASIPVHSLECVELLRRSVGCKWHTQP